MQVNLQYAEEHFADLADAVDGGQVVEIARPDKPTLKLVASATPPARKPRKELLGGGEGLITLPTDEEWAAMDKEIEDLMLKSPLLPED